ncbi:hypothetical protein [Nocardiopsis algeriensis]|uniref:Uncharacterized protein n=1 Tax=Nocardiopsis algeriensis TaxID=1478215 RepID=A0A841IXV8_9ACTN|nr:hypothetical protein [Nocardiopsis algeriensis]MBB6121068.1 hypothetical protein [Nocardiopsis algeriensis]
MSLLTVTPTMADEEDPSSAGDSTSETEELDALALAEQAGEPVETTSLTDEKTRHYLGVCR